MADAEVDGVDGVDGVDVRLVLASASPRRLDLLRAAGLDPAVRAADVDEDVRPGEDPIAYVARLAREKAAAVARAGEVVVAADTTVVLDGQVIGKPVDAAAAAATLRRLAGRTHSVATGVAVIGATGALSATTVTTDVEVVALDDAAIHAYVATGEPFGKAGAYAVQGRAAAFVARVVGSYTNVVGLPLAEALALLEAAGVPTPLGGAWGAASQSQRPSPGVDRTSATGR